MASSDGMPVGASLAGGTAVDCCMVRKAFAALLLMLVALPFTAPFPTCDAGTLFGDHTTAVPHQ
jgi:hypothetical protein